MAGGKPTTEVPVEIDADGKAIFAVFNAVQKKLVEINGQVAKIGTTAVAGGKDFQKALDQTVKDLQRAMGAMSTMAKAQNTPGMNIQLQNAQKSLAAQTRGATEYAQSLNTARDAAEALKGKINDLNRQIAARGVKDQGATIQQRDRLALYEKQLAALKALDVQQERNDRRLSRTKGGDLSAEVRAVEAARARLEAAALNPNRNGLSREIKAAQQAQDQLTDAINRTRNAQAQLIREQQMQRTALVGREVRSMVGANGGNSQAVAQSLRAQQQAAENRLAVATGAGIAPAREALILAEKRVRAIEAIVRGEERAAAATARGNAVQKPNSILPAGGFPTVFARTAAYGAAGTAIFSLVAAVKQGADFAVQFEDKLKTLQAIANATDEEMVGLQKSIEGVGANSRYSLIDLTEMGAKLAQAGVSASTMGQALESVSMLATASGSSPAEAVDLITAALGAFQLQASETPRVADLMTSALNETRLTVQQAALAIQYVGATAYEQNISLETLLATSAALSQAGIRSGSTIGTGMRQFLVDLQSPSEKLTASFDKLKISAADVDVSVRGLPAVLETLNEKGFGAASAYGALETRAAAFYLVARNNTDLMRNLQLQMTETGATTVAQERAMDSLTAQWQRFKNIVGTGFAESAQETLDLFKDVLRKISDNMIEARRLADESRIRQEQGVDRGYDGNYAAYALEYDLGKPMAKVLEFAGNQLWQDGNGGGFGSWLYNNSKYGNEMSGAMERLTTKMNEQEQAATKHQETIGGLDKEMARLQLQQETIDSTMGGVNLETAALTSRFEGLAGQMVGTVTTVKELIGAMERLKNVESGLMIEQLNGRIATANETIATATPLRQRAVDDFKANPQYMARMSQQERRALNSLSSENPEIRMLASRILTDLQSRLTNEKTGFGSAMSQALGKAINFNSNVASAEGSRRVDTQTRDMTNWMTRTPIGQAISTTTRNVEALIAEMRSASPEKRAQLSGRIDAELSKTVANLRANIAKFPASQTGLQSQALAQLLNYRVQARGIMDSGKPEKAGAVGKTRLITADDILRIAQDISPGVRTDGSERRSREWQNDAFRRKITPADADTSYHTRHDGVAKDIPGSWGAKRGKELAAAMNERARQQGLKVFYQWESGKGKYGGTGEHIHGQALKNQRIADGDYAREDRAERKIDISNDKLGLGVKADRLQSAMRSLGDATTEEAFKTAALGSEAALNEWAKQLRAVAAEELVANGSLPNQIADRNREVENQIAQKREEMVAQIKRKAEDFQQAQLKTILKTLENSLDAAQQAFDAAMKPSADRIAGLEAQSQGLGFASNEGRVPDYVQQLVARRIAVAQEDQVRMRSSQLPALIDSKNQALNIAQNDLNTKDWSKLPAGEFDSATLKVNELRMAVAGLTAEKTNLDLALGAEGLIPRTLGDGLQQAILAFQQANNVGQSFTDMLIGNMGGALQTVHQGFETMFSDIMTGSQTVLGAFRNFAQGMIKYMIQLAAKALALKVFNMILGAVAGKAAGGAAGNPGFGSEGLNNAFSITGSGYGGFNGAANINGQWMPALMGGGGRVNKGSATRDSVMAAIAKDEWVVNSRATKSVGHDFMAKLNSQGAAALDAMRGSPVIVPQAPQEMNVWVVKPDEKPQLGKNDVLLMVHEDIMAEGETKKLIKHVAQNN